MKTVITIGRQFGSGGKEIGQKLAQHYGIKCYDSELLTEVAKSSGFCEEIIEQQDERPTNSFLFNLVMDTYSFGGNASSFMGMPLSQKIFLAQFDIIKKLAAEGPCVFIGRCADSALSTFPDSLDIFIHADEDFRIQRVLHDDQYVECKGKDVQKVRDILQKHDRQRQSYYNYYSSGKWGVSSTYDFSINSALLGIDGTVDALVKMIDAFDSRNQKQI